MSGDDALAFQLEATDSIWATLRDAGVTEGQFLSIDFFFYGRPRAAVDALARELAPQVADVQVRPVRPGMFRRPVEWSATGSTRSAPASLGSLRAWVTEMVWTGERHGVEFDGWGAALPDR